MTKEIAQSQSKDTQQEQLDKEEGYATQLVENIKNLCKDDTLVVPKDLHYWESMVPPLPTALRINAPRRNSSNVCKIPSDHMSKCVIVVK